MLRVPEIDDITYEQLVERAINKIPTMTDKWTDFNFSDPGVTVLQTYAWLVDMLNYYMNATGDVHVEKYLKLLGIKPIEKCAAKATLCIESDTDSVSLKRGTAFLAGETPFFLKEDIDFASNRFISYINEIDDNAIDLTMFAGIDGDFADIFSENFSNKAIGYFGFEKPLAKQFDLYITVEENKKRNTFYNNLSFGNLDWEYSSPSGFQKLKVVKDQTCGLLKSGTITFELDEAESASVVHEANGKSAFYIRCVLKDKIYDMIPRIGKVFLNPIEVEQTQNYCRQETLVYRGSSEIDIPGYVADDALIIVGLQQMDGSFRVIYNYSYSENKGCEIVNGENEGDKRIVLSAPWTRIVKGTKIQVTIFSMDIMPYFSLGVSDGCNNQKIEFDFDDVYQMSVALWEKRRDGNMYYIPYKQVRDINTASFSDYVFSYDSDEHALTFGDAIHGVLPKKNQIICLAELCTSEFDNGNVVAGGVDTLVAENAEHYHVTNPQAASGGRKTESIPEMIHRLRENLFVQHRLVSEKDYIETIKKTPGLMIDMVSVIPDKEYALYHNRVHTSDEVVVVKPYSKEKTPVLSDIYKKIIEKHIEPLRMINTKIQIVSPSYVGIEVHAKIHLKNGAESERNEIVKVLEEELSYDKQKEAFGHAIVLGKVFTRLDALDGVKYIEQLSLERIGQGADKNARGDILLHKDALSYIYKLDIEYV